MTFGAALRTLATALLFVSVPASASAGTDTKTLSAPTPAASLSVSPSHVRLVPGANGTIQVTNAGAGRVLVSAGPAGYALDLRGRAQIGGQGRGASAWLTLRPARLVLAPGATAPVVVTAAPRRHVPPGDHPALVLFEARPAGTARVAVAVRLGIVVDIRVTGPVVRRIDIRALRVRRTGQRRTLEVVLANRGNVSELVTGRRLSVVLRKRGRVVATLRGAPQTLLPHTAGLVELRYRGALHGALLVVVKVRSPGTGRRSFRLRL